MLEEDLKLVTAKADGLITNKPSWLYSISQASTTFAECTASIYNGRDSGGDLFFKLHTGQYITKVKNFNYPVYFPDGIYLSVSASPALMVFQIYEMY